MRLIFILTITIFITPQAFTQMTPRISKNHVLYRKGNIFFFYRVMDDGKAWMTENLNVIVKEPGWLKNDNYCYKDDRMQCTRYGRLYSWHAAQEACELVGDGWRLPTDDEWKEMTNKYGGAYPFASDHGTAAYRELFMPQDNASHKFTTSSDNFAGYRHPKGYFKSQDIYGSYWTSTRVNTSKRNAWAYSIHSFSGKLSRQSANKNYGYSIRCVRDPINTDPIPLEAQKTIEADSVIKEQKTIIIASEGKRVAEEGIVKDPSGNKYSWKVMDDGHKWLTQNLNYNFSNSIGESYESYCYENEGSNCEKYGRLYTYKSALAGCKSLGDNWELPMINAWKNLFRAYSEAYKRNNGEFDIYNDAYKALIEGSNSGFNAHLGGQFQNEKKVSPHKILGMHTKEKITIRFHSLERVGIYWSKTAGYDAGTSYSISFFGPKELTTNGGTNLNTNAFSVRCIQYKKNKD